MSTTKDDRGTKLEAHAHDLKASLMRPVTFTAPLYGYLAAGLALLALIVVAID